MKTLTLFLSLLFSFPFVLSAQMVERLCRRSLLPLITDSGTKLLLCSAKWKYQCRESRNVLLDRCG